MALTKDDLDTLDEAIASGELTVRVEGREITYRSIDDLLKARRHVASVLKGGRKRSFLGSRMTTRVDRGIR